MKTDAVRGGEAVITERGGETRPSEKEDEEKSRVERGGLNKL